MLMFRPTLDSIFVIGDGIGLGSTNVEARTSSLIKSVNSDGEHIVHESTYMSI